MTWVHWVLYNLSPQANHLPAGIREAELPRGTQAGLNDFKNTRYGGPCPPIGRHRYVHTLYALDTVLPDLRVRGLDFIASSLHGERWACHPSPSTTAP